jgi:hypothetical protein
VPVPLTRLAYLPGWHVAEGEPDIRGWPLQLDQGGPLTITDLIVDTAACNVRYVVLSHEQTGATRLLPVGYLRIERERQLVQARALTADDILALPAYDGGGVSRIDEDQLTAALRARLAGRRRYFLADYYAPHDAARAG